MRIKLTIDQSLALAKARQEAYARDPEKYEEMQNDAKLYPEEDNDRTDE